MVGRKVANWAKFLCKNNEKVFVYTTKGGWGDDEQDWSMGQSNLLKTSLGKRRETAKKWLAVGKSETTTREQSVACCLY